MIREDDLSIATAVSPSSNTFSLAKSGSSFPRKTIEVHITNIEFRDTDSDLRLIAEMEASINSHHNLQNTHSQDPEEAIGELILTQRHLNPLERAIWILFHSVLSKAQNAVSSFIPLYERSVLYPHSWNSSYVFS